MLSSTIFALDLGTFNSVLCWFDPATQDATLLTAATTPEDLLRELTRQLGRTRRFRNLLRGRIGFTT